MVRECNTYYQNRPVVALSLQKAAHFIERVKELEKENAELKQREQELARKLRSSAVMVKRDRDAS